jgi:hypothetical protein
VWGNREGSEARRDNVPINNPDIARLIVVAVPALLTLARAVGRPLLVSEPDPVDVGLAVEVLEPLTLALLEPTFPLSDARGKRVYSQSVMTGREVGGAGCPYLALRLELGPPPTLLASRLFLLICPFGRGRTTGRAVRPPTIGLRAAGRNESDRLVVALRVVHAASRRIRVRRLVAVASPATAGIRCRGRLGAELASARLLPDDGLDPLTLALLVLLAPNALALDLGAAEHANLREDAVALVLGQVLGGEVAQVMRRIVRHALPTVLRRWWRAT